MCWGGVNFEVCECVAGGGGVGGVGGWVAVCFVGVFTLGLRGLQAKSSLHMWKSRAQCQADSAQRALRRRPKPRQSLHTLS